MSLRPIFPSVTERFVGDWILSALRSPYYSGSSALFLSTVPPWIFIDYDRLRLCNKSTFEYYAIVVSAIAHEFTHILQFIFLDRCSRERSIAQWTIEREDIPSTVQMAILFLLVAWGRKPYRWADYRQCGIRECRENVSRMNTGRRDATQRSSEAEGA